MPEVILIRHGEVEEQWKTICYGAMDIPLSNKGQVESRQLARQLATGQKPHAIFHSDLVRTRFLAEQLAQAWGSQLPLIADARLRERNYGQWQGLTWDQAYASDPEHFQDLIDRPDTYRPPDGETTSSMQQRIVSWYRDTMADRLLSADARVIAVSHSGPIAALAGWHNQVPASQWSEFLLKPLESVSIDSAEQNSGSTQIQDE